MKEKQRKVATVAPTSIQTLLRCQEFFSSQHKYVLLESSWIQIGHDANRNRNSIHPAKMNISEQIKRLMSCDSQRSLKQKQDRETMRRLKRMIPEECAHEADASVAPLEDEYQTYLAVVGRGAVTNRPTDRPTDRSTATAQLGHPTKTGFASVKLALGLLCSTRKLSLLWIFSPA